MKDHSALLIVFIFVIYLVWLAYDTFSFTSPEGNLKRGIPIWRRPLPEEFCSFLNHLPGDIIEGRDFIRKAGNQVLVRKRLGGKVFINEAALISLDPMHLHVEYRVPLSQAILLVAMSLTIILLPLSLFLFMVNHFFYSGAILKYIRTHMQNAG